ncbi:NADPH:quinone oxidoreductase family protein [Paracoccus aerodenitrificans]|nr:NADPH:quinone oxidoreductase family protein [Paracoccus aerodenitrificans]WBU65713.1 NADPH:quinone oxidoreductase family protein [Paracoccus aerodenitrificans]
MRAVQSVVPGGTDTLELREIEVPVPGAGEILLNVQAVGVNYPDLLIIEDKYQYRPERPFSPGAEVSGIVAALGDGVEEPVIGTRVIAMSGWGGMSEKIILPAEKCFAIPDEMPMDEAAAFLMTYGTSWHALRDRAQLKAGETLLVLGAAGGVGLAAVELGAAIGAKVIAAASSEEKLAAAREAGAAETLLYPAGVLDKNTQRAFSRKIRELAGNPGANVIYDPVGGSYAEPALRAIARGGRYLIIGFPAGIPSLPFNLPLLKECDVRGVFWGSHIEHDPEGHARAVSELLALYREGRIRPRIHSRLPLEQGAEAIDMLSTRGVMGKVVVTI